MDLVARLSRQTIRIGSSDACEICLIGKGVAPVHAEVIHHGLGRLSLIPGNTGRCFQNGRELKPSVAVPFDFSATYRMGEAVLSNTHPDLCVMVMSRGRLTLADEQLIVGRDPERCHLVLNSPGVSGLHAILRFLPEITATDQGSTSGTWWGEKRLEPYVATTVQEDSLLALGPLPLPVSLAKSLHHALRQDTGRTTQRTEAMPMRTAEQRAMPSSPVSRPSARHRTIMGTVRMDRAAVHTIGRTPENDIVLDYAQISGRHARLTTVGDELFIEDAGSELGTQVRGTRLRLGQKAKINDGERLLLGPLPAILQRQGDTVAIIVEDREGWAGRPLFDVAAAGVTVQVPDRDNKKRLKTLLADVHFRAQPGDLVALMGPSGSGKTTLLHALAGYLRPQYGEVLINGRPLPEVFDSLRGTIGYVPQDDIIHPELTVFEAVHYSARFRLPSDYNDDEIDRRVRLTLSQLGLEAVSHLQIGRPEHKILSGGQRKRVNIAMELVTDPVLLFLDEPTSGLAADDTTSLVDLLAHLARESGKTIIATIHQPARDEYEKFNLALVLGHGGIPLYFGPTAEAYSFFEKWRGTQEIRGISNPRDMFAELKEREVRFEKEMAGATRQEIREAVSLAYRRDFKASQIAEDMNDAGRSTEGVYATVGKLPRRAQPRRQLRLLLGRYLKIKARDRVGSTILLLQAPLIGLLLSLVFGATKPSVPYWCLGALNELSQRGGRLSEASSDVISRISETPDHSGALFFLVVAAVWFGTSNASREIVAERAIFRRERMVNLGVSNYVLSKFVVLGVLSALQCVVLLSIVFYSLGLGGGGNAYAISMGMMVLTALCSVGLGLLLSAAVSSGEAAMALTPIALIPQVVLGGLMVPVTTNPWLKLPMMTVPARWGFEGVVRPERIAVQSESAWRISLPGAPESAADYIESEHFLCALAQMQSSSLRGAWGFSGPDWMSPTVLVSMTVGLLILVMLLLRRSNHH